MRVKFKGSCEQLCSVDVENVKVPEKSNNGEL